MLIQSWFRREGVAIAAPSLVLSTGVKRVRNKKLTRLGTVLSPTLSGDAIAPEIRFLMGPFS